MRFLVLIVLIIVAAWLIWIFATPLAQLWSKWLKSYFTEGSDVKSEKTIPEQVSGTNKREDLSNEQ